METNIIVMSGLQLRKLLEKKLFPITKAYDIRQVELEILVFLAKNKCDDTAKAIMQKKHISKAHISKSINNLHIKGLIQLAEDELDHRVVHISLEEKAYIIVEQVLHIYEECRNILQRNISPKEIAVMRKVLQKMNDNIEEEIKKA